MCIGTQIDKKLPLHQQTVVQTDQKHAEGNMESTSCALKLLLQRSFVILEFLDASRDRSGFAYNTPQPGESVKG